MRIAVSSTGRGIYDAVDLRLGRSTFFVIVDPEASEYTVVENRFTQGIREAGLQTAQLLVDLKVEVVVTGQIGPHALRVLNDAGVRVRTGDFTTVRDAIEAVLRGSLDASPVAGMV